MRRAMLVWVATAKAASLSGCGCRAAWFDGRRVQGWVAAVAAFAALLLVPSMSLAQAPPPNDNYLSSTIIPQAETTGTQPGSFEQSEDTSAATTQADLFNPDKSGMPFGGAGPEPLMCHGSTYGNTIWYDLHPKIPGGVELVAAGFPTSIALYQWSLQTALITRRVGCQASTSLVNDYAVPVDVQKGKVYTVQIGGLNTPSGFASGLLDFKMTFYPDHDGDGIFDVLDKCPSTPGVERFGGCPPAIQPLPRYTYEFIGSGLRLTSLRLDQIPSGAQVVARCRQCGLRQVLQVGPHASSVIMTGFAGQILAVGDTVEIWVTKRATGTGIYKYGAFGSYIRYTVNSGAVVGRLLRCLMPGSLTPRRVCPPGGRRSVPSHLGRGLGMPGAAWRRVASTL